MRINMNLKKLFSFVIALVLVLSLHSSTVFASDLEVNDVQPRYVPVCGSYATHDMLSSGWGDIYNSTTGKTVVSMGACHQCTRCHLVLVCQGEPLSGSALGTWAVYEAGEKLTSSYNILYRTTAQIFYTSSSSIAGYTFRYSY